MRRRWLMQVGPARVVVETVLDLALTVAEVRASGDSLVFDLDECGAARSDPDVARVVHVQGNHTAPSVVYDGEHHRLTVSDGGDRVSGVELLYLSYLLLEACLHHHGVVTLHAAAAEQDGRAVVILGHAGAGKTTTVLRLCQGYGFRLVGNDLAVVGGVADAYAWGGTTHLRLRLSSIARVMPELLRLFPAGERDPWRTKRDLSPAELGIEVADHPTVVAAAVFVHVDRAYSTLVTAAGDSLVHRLNLYENSLRYVRATSTPWRAAGRAPFQVYVPSLDDPQAHELRVVTLHRLLARSRYVAGPPANVASYIADLLGAVQMAGGKLLERL